MANSAYPYLFYTPFEGTVHGWTSETDTDNKLNYENFTQLAKWSLTPYRGAGAIHIDLSGGTNDAYLQEDTALDLAASGSVFIGFYVYIDRLVMADGDRFNIFSLQSAAGTDEVSVSVLYTAAAGYQFVAAETGATAIGAGTRATSLIQGAWHHISLRVLVDSGVGNDGTIYLFVDGQQIGAVITGLDQGAIIHGRLGVTGLDAGTTAGHIVYDEFIADADGIILPYKDRFPTSVMIVAADQQVFIGPGVIKDAYVATVTGSDSIELYDTDLGNAYNSTFAVLTNVNDIEPVARLVYAAGLPAIRGPVQFKRGCFASVVGSSAKAIVVIDSGDAGDGGNGPTFYSNQGYLDWARSRKTNKDFLQ